MRYVQLAAFPLPLLAFLLLLPIPNYSVYRHELGIGKLIAFGLEFVNANVLSSPLLPGQIRS